MLLHAAELISMPSRENAGAVAEALELSKDSKSDNPSFNPPSESDLDEDANMFGGSNHNNIEQNRGEGTDGVDKELASKSWTCQTDCTHLLGCTERKSVEAAACGWLQFDFRQESIQDSGLGL